MVPAVAVPDIHRIGEFHAFQCLQYVKQAAFSLHMSSPVLNLWNQEEMTGTPALGVAALARPSCAASGPKQGLDAATIHSPDILAPHPFDPLSTQGS